MSYCDSHCHLDSISFDADRKACVDRAEEAGLSFILNPGTDLSGSARAIALSEAFPGFIYAMVGVHPTDRKNLPANWPEKVRTMAKNPKVVAIGEIGLDYYHDAEGASEQRELLEQQLRLAAELALPVSLHSRESGKDMLSVLRSWWLALEEGHPLKKSPGVLHAFSENTDYAKAVISMGFKLGIGGPVSFKNAHDHHELVRELPLDSLMLETDAPYMTPVPFRGRRNEPAYIPYIAGAIGALKGLTAQEVGEACLQNTLQVFNRVRP